jgi:hypothetical protein
MRGPLICSASLAAVCQWVLSLPKRLRYCLQSDREALNSALRVLLVEIEHHLWAQSPGAGPKARTGAMACIHFSIIFVA